MQIACLVLNSNTKLLATSAITHPCRGTITTFLPSRPLGKMAAFTYYNGSTSPVISLPIDCVALSSAAMTDATSVGFTPKKWLANAAKLNNNKVPLISPNTVWSKPLARIICVKVKLLTSPNK